MRQRSVIKSRQRYDDEIMIEISPHPEGCLLSIRAQPGARKNQVQIVESGPLKVAVTTPPEGGKANTALVELLREFLNLKRSQIELHSGATSRNKRFLIRDHTAEELRQKITSLESDQ
jgi:uncharacterized protein (TIGR00251 family)